MVVYNPNKNSHSSNDSCNCHNKSNLMTYHVNHHDHHCYPDHYEHYDHCDCDDEITISVDEAPEIRADVLYGPPGKDGTINGHNEVIIEGGSNIDIDERKCPCHHQDKMKLIINSTTYEERNIDSHEYDNDFNDECECNNENECDCICIEQVKLKSVWDIHHNLNKYPSVTVVDNKGKEIICEVRYISPKHIKLLFNGKFKGKAYLN